VSHKNHFSNSRCHHGQLRGQRFKYVCPGNTQNLYSDALLATSSRCLPFKEKAIQSWGSLGPSVCHENLTLAITLPFLNISSSNF